MRIINRFQRRRDRQCHLFLILPVLFTDYEGNVGLGYYTWMNGGKPSRWPLRIRLPIWNWLTNSKKQNVLSGNIALDYKGARLEDLRFNLNMGYDIQKNDNRENVPDLAPPCTLVIRMTVRANAINTIRPSATPCSISMPITIRN